VVTLAFPSFNLRFNPGDNMTYKIKYLEHETHAPKIIIIIFLSVYILQ